MAAAACNRGAEVSYTTRGTRPADPTTTSSEPASTTTSPPTTLPPVAPTTTTTRAKAPVPRPPHPSTTVTPPPTVPVAPVCAAAMPLAPGWLFTAEALDMTRSGELWVAGWGH